MSDEEKIEKWRASCADKNKKLKHDPEQGGKKEPLGEGCKTPNNEAQSDKPVIVGNQTSAILLKLTMLQGIHPIKFSGNPSDYPTFRNTLRDNLEDGILNDSQKLEFLPKFLSGEAYEVVARVSGCSYDSVLRILHERYGQPAAVAAACIESLTKGPKLKNNDYTGLLNFAEQLEVGSKRLSGHYELKASTVANLRQIVTRLPNYLVNKWGEVSDSIREKGGIPRLSDLSKFVRRQAAIKNDPGFAAEKKPERQNGMNIKGPTSNSRGHTNAFHTDLEAGGLSINYQNLEKRNLGRYLRCSKDHEIAECEQFIPDEIQARWGIVKQNKLCHVCLKSRPMRGRCESRIFFSCRSDRRHHRLLRNPLRPRDAITAQDPHLDRQRETQAARADIQYKDQGKLFPQNPRAMEQYATITEVPSRTSLLHVVPAKVIAPSGSSLTTYALPDNASRGTIISKNIANSLGLKGPLQLVSVNTVVEKTSEHFQLVRFELQSATGTGEIIKVEEGLVSEKFNIPERCLPEDIDNSRYPHLEKIEIPEVQVKAVSVLIGKDGNYAHEVFEVRKPSSPNNRLKALRGPLGWVVTGSVNFTNCEKNLRELVEDFWKLEAFGTQGATEVEKANKLTGYQHRKTGPWKICAQLKLCKGRLGCLTGVMRQVCCGVVKMSGYPTTVVKQRGECTA